MPMGKRKLQHFHIYLVLCWLYKIYIPPNATFDPTYTHALDACVPDDYYPYTGLLRWKRALAGDVGQNTLVRRARGNKI